MKYVHTYYTLYTIHMRHECVGRVLDRGFVGGGVVGYTCTQRRTHAMTLFRRLCCNVLYISAGNSLVDIVCKINFERGHFTTISPDRYIYQ